jgi:Histidine kinase-, DNA gyrase B-, and HSP90-like ATPase
MRSSLTPNGTKTLPLTVQNTGFLLDRLGQDCHPLQFLRELTQNAIEAISRTPSQRGEIIWDVDWTLYDLESRVKLSVVDTGDGMTGEEMVKYINQLSSSVHDQTLGGNYGVGAKIAAATRNHAGLIYLSWKDSQGSMIHLWRDPDSGQYGLRQIERPDGSFGHYASVEETVKPEEIREHGTKIILLGSEEPQDTMQAPEEVSSPSRWIAKYLNSRYFRFPEGITIRAREGWEYPRTDKDRNLLRTVTGQEKYLRQHAESSGTVDLTCAKAHWWILKGEEAIAQNSGFIESAGHVAALYQNELYEVVSGRSATARLQQFGVVLGHRRVVIYVEPQSEDSIHITTNTARTQLLIDNLPLPWADWAAEFRDRMPVEIEALIQQVAAGSTSTDHTQSIRERLKEILDLFRVSRYRSSASGDALIDESRRTRGGEPQRHGAGQRSVGPSRRGTKGGAAGGVYSVFLKKNGVPAKPLQPDVFPRIMWVSVKDGTREPEDIEDRAARFLVEQNELLMNGDFRVFADMMTRWAREYKERPGVFDIVQDVVRNWFAQALVETVIGIQTLKDSREWSVEDVERALSEEALTAAAMSRYHINACVRRELAFKLGRLMAA